MVSPADGPARTTLTAPLWTLKLLPVSDIAALAGDRAAGQSDGPHAAGPLAIEVELPAVDRHRAGGGQGVGNAVVERAAADGRAARVTVGGGGQA